MGQVGASQPQNPVLGCHLGSDSLWCLLPCPPPHPQAGLVSREDAEQLLIALEPEAASVYCRKLRLHQLMDLSSRAPGGGRLGERRSIDSSFRQGEPRPGTAQHWAGRQCRPWRVRGLPGQRHSHIQNEGRGAATLGEPRSGGRGCGGGLRQQP